MTKKTESQCVVSAADYARFWYGTGCGTADTTNPIVYVQREDYIYSGPERRANAHDRRFYAGQGGRRMLDRKS